MSKSPYSLLEEMGQLGHDLNQARVNNDPKSIKLSKKNIMMIEGTISALARILEVTGYEGEIDYDRALKETVNTDAFRELLK